MMMIYSSVYLLVSTGVWKERGVELQTFDTIFLLRLLNKV